MIVSIIEIPIEKAIAAKEHGYFSLKLDDGKIVGLAKHVEMDNEYYINYWYVDDEFQYPYYGIMDLLTIVKEIDFDAMECIVEPKEG